MAVFKISVIVPVYNAEKYLVRCLDSIINQTYKNLEIILVNDGSTDNSGLICDEYAKRDNRIIVIHKENAGVSAARNDGIDMATGDYIGFIDSDDWVDENMYELLLTYIIRYPNLDLIVFGVMHEYYKDAVLLYSIPHHIPTQIYFSSNKEFQENYLSLSEQGLYNSCWNKLFKYHVVKDKTFDVNMRLAEDLYFGVDVFSDVNNILIIDDTPYHYFQDLGRVPSYTDLPWNDMVNIWSKLHTKLIAWGVSKKHADNDLARKLLMAAYAYIHYILQRKESKGRHEILIEIKAVLNSLPKVNIRRVLIGENKIQMGSIMFFSSFKMYHFCYLFFMVLKRITRIKLWLKNRRGKHQNRYNVKKVLK